MGICSSADVDVHRGTKVEISNDASVGNTPPVNKEVKKENSSTKSKDETSGKVDKVSKAQYTLLTTSAPMDRRNSAPAQQGKKLNKLNPETNSLDKWEDMQKQQNELRTKSSKGVVNLNEGSEKGSFGQRRRTRSAIVYDDIEKRRINSVDLARSVLRFHKYETNTGGTGGVMRKRSNSKSALFGRRFSIEQEDYSVEPGRPFSNVHNRKLSVSQTKKKMDFGMIEAVLSSNIVFASFTGDSRKLVIKDLKRKSYMPGDFIVVQGELGDSFYIVSEGELEVLLHNTVESCKKLAVLTRGASFGDLALLFNRPRTASVQCTTKVVVWYLTSKQYRSHIVHTPNFKAKNFLSKTALFAWLSDDERIEVAKQMKMKKYLKDSYLYEQDGEDRDIFYLVIKGKVRVSRRKALNQNGIISSVEETLQELRRWQWTMIGSDENIRTIRMIQESTIKKLTEGVTNNLTEKASLLNVFGAEIDNCPKFKDPATASAQAKKTTTVLRIPASVLVTKLQPLLTEHFKSCIDASREMLSQTAFFCVLKPDVIDGIYSKMEVQKFAPGDIICSEGEVGDACYVLVEGRVKVSKGSKMNPPIIMLATIQPPFLFGEKALISEAPRSATCTAAEEGATLLVLSKQNLLGSCPDSFLEDLRKRQYVARLHGKKGRLLFTDLDLKEEIGRGTFGSVRLAQHRTSRQTYAVKIMQKKRILLLQQVEHVLNERRIMAELSHPFLCKLIATIKADDKVCLVEEFCCGGELMKQMQDNIELANEKTEQNCRFYMAALYLALEYMHKHRIVYRDLKPENVLLSRTGYPKLIDFGFSKNIGRGKTFTICGTVDYMAPEVVMNKGHGLDVDWWSLGVLVYEFIAGYTPFSKKGTLVNESAIFENICYATVEYPSTISPGLSDLLSHFLNKEPKKRSGWRTGQERDVRRHPWLKGVEWERLLKLELETPFKVNIKSDHDISMFNLPEGEPGGLESVTLDQKYVIQHEGWENDW